MIPQTKIGREEAAISDSTTPSSPANPFQERVDAAKSLFGILPNDVTLEAAREAFLQRLADEPKQEETAEAEPIEEISTEEVASISEDIIRAHRRVFEELADGEP